MLIAFEVLLLSRISLFQFLKVNIKQECIPVGCVPLARNRTDGVSLTKTQWIETPLDRDPLDWEHPEQTLGQRPLWTETPLDSDSPGQRPPGQRLPWTETLQTETPRQRPLWQRPSGPWTETPWTETLLTETPPIGQSKKKSFNFYCKVMWNSTIGLK